MQAECGRDPTQYFFIETFFHSGYTYICHKSETCIENVHCQHIVKMKVARLDTIYTGSTYFTHLLLKSLSFAVMPII